MIDPLLFAVPRLSTFEHQRHLTNASGFFFRRDDRLYLVTSRHVVVDEPSSHFPNRLEIELHTDPDNFAQSTGFSILLYKDGESVWRDGSDGSGNVDIAVIEIDETALPDSVLFRAFTPDHLVPAEAKVEIGSTLLVVGFPLGFHDTLHHLPIVRQAVVSSSYGMRFQGDGYFLTDARTHRGTSGAPVVMRSSDPKGQLGDLQWSLLGVHSARLDIGTRDLVLDEALGLNCAWYADILMVLANSGKAP